LGDLFGRFFIEVDSIGESKEVHFGFELAGQSFIKRTVSIARIKSVEWSPGQATSMAGRDMNDWSVSVRFDSDDPQKRHNLIEVLGPSVARVQTETLGLAVVEFLRNSGVELTQGTTTTCFVRQ
jgi:hypothetical protein